MSPAIEWTLMIAGWTTMIMTLTITKYKMVKVGGGVRNLKTDEMRKETMLANIIFILYLFVAGITAHIILLPDFIQYEFMAHYFHFFLGIFIFTIAIWLYISSRIALGSNWTWKGELLRNKNKLITRGPYYVIRHPTYTAYLLAGFSSGIIIATSRVIFFMILMLPIIYWRAKVDEKHLNEIFPEYKEYKKRTRMFF